MGAWDKAPQPEGPAVNFVSLKNTGDEFVGRVESVELITIPAGTLPQQPQDLVDVPKVVYTGVDGQSYEFKYTTAVFKNGILRLRPEPGTWVYHKRLGKKPGKSYFDGIVREARPEEYERTSRTAQPVPENTSYTVPAAQEAKSSNAEPSGPVGDDAPPF